MGAASLEQSSGSPTEGGGGRWVGEALEGWGSDDSEQAREASRLVEAADAAVAAFEQGVSEVEAAAKAGASEAAAVALLPARLHEVSESEETTLESSRGNKNTGRHSKVNWTVSMPWVGGEGARETLSEDGGRRACDEPPRRAADAVQSPAKTPPSP